MNKTSGQNFIADADQDWEIIAAGTKRKIIAYNEGVMLVKVAFEQGGTGAVHSHYHTQITHIDSGRFEVEIGGERKILQAGDAFFVPPHALHGVVCLEAGVLVDVFSPMR